MTYPRWRIAIVTLLIALSGSAAARPLTVVELFQSQGCSSCPPANANVMALADRSDLLTLSFGVTYWDRLGWKDTFASPQYTARQWDYAHALHHAEVYTPQVVINGRADIVGADAGALKALIDREGPVTGPALTLNKGSVSVASGPAGTQTGAEVWLVRYDPNIVQVPVTRGENSGVTLPHRNVVKQLVKLGDWRGAAADYVLPAASNPAWRDAILLQAGTGGPIIAAARG
jgi:hypothetical protein